MADIIQTTKNKTYKYIKSLQQKKIRAQEGVFSVEGIKSVSDAFEAGKNIKILAVSESFYSEGGTSRFRGTDVVIIKDGLFQGLCDTKTPQGIIAVMDMFDTDNFVPDKNQIYVYCDGISDPGNAGTIIRTADAAGIGGVIFSKGSVDIYSPKTVRASMGSFFHTNIKTGGDADFLADMKSRGFNLFAGALSKDSVPYTEVDFKEPSVIIVGNEANGVSEEVLEMSNHIIIPIYGRAESLNAGVAAAVMIYGAVRCRKEQNNER